MYDADLAAFHAAHATALAREAATTLVDELAEGGVLSGTVADVGCGDGTLAELLVDAGYDVLAADPSPALLEMAGQRVPEAQLVLTTAARLRLPGRLAAVACVGEVLAYDLELDLDEACEAFHRALRPGGVVLLDLPGPGRHADGEQVVHEHPDAVLLMRAEERGFRLRRSITLFTDAGGGRYRRSEEVHELRLYDPGDVRTALARAGFVAIRQLERYGARGPLFGRGWAGFVAAKP